MHLSVQRDKTWRKVTIEGTVTLDHDLRGPRLAETLKKAGVGFIAQMEKRGLRWAEVMRIKPYPRLYEPLPADGEWGTVPLDLEGAQGKFVYEYVAEFWAPTFDTEVLVPRDQLRKGYEWQPSSN